MFNRSRPVPFDPYGRRRSRWRLPRWLVLLLVGIALGAGGVVVVQERYLPPRLSADASVKLSSALEQAQAERTRLQSELGATSKRLETAIAEKKGQVDALASGRTTTEQLRQDVDALIASLPPDPRGGDVEVRAARFAVKGSQLAYDIVLTRERAKGKAQAAVMQLVVAGTSARGADASITLAPVALSLGGQQIVHGSQPLPDGFKPRQTTVQVLDRVGGKSLGMRVMLVK